MNQAPFCQACGRQVPAKYCEFTQGIGMVVIRTSRRVRGNLCRHCASKYFWEMTGLTLITGWWGIISFVMNIIFIISNIAYFIGSRFLPKAAPAQPATTTRSSTMGLAPVPTQSTPPGAPLTPSARPPTSRALASLRNDIVLRLRSGETPQQVASFLAPLSGLSAEDVRRYATQIAQGQA